MTMLVHSRVYIGICLPCQKWFLVIYAGHTLVGLLANIGMPIADHKLVIRWQNASQFNMFNTVTHYSVFFIVFGANDT